MESFQESHQNISIYFNIYLAKSPWTFNFYSYLSHYMHTDHFLSALIRTFQPKWSHSPRGLQVWPRQWFLLPSLHPKHPDWPPPSKMPPHSPPHPVDGAVWYLYQDTERSETCFKPIVITAFLSRVRSLCRWTNKLNHIYFALFWV